MYQIDQGGIFGHLEVEILDFGVLIDVNFPLEITITRTITIIEVATMIRGIMAAIIIDLITLGAGGLHGEGEIQEVDHLVGVRECSSRHRTPNPPHLNLNHATGVKGPI